MAEGYLPIVEILYTHPSPRQAEGNVPLNQTVEDRVPEIYRLEAFASTDPDLAEQAVVLACLSLAQGDSGLVTAEIDAEGPLRFADRTVRDAEEGPWRTSTRTGAGNEGPLTPDLRRAREPCSRYLPSRWRHPLPGSRWTPTRISNSALRCAETWRNLLAQGMDLETPEPRVNHAWRNLVIQNFQLLKGDRMHYSAGNQYDQLYEAEGSDAALALLLWGYEEEMRRTLVPLLEFTRKGLEYHQAGLKLNDVCRLYWQTRDAPYVTSLRPRWSAEVQRILDGRSGTHGLFPQEQYCGDIKTPVHSLSAVAKAWRAVRDLSAVLEDMDDDAESHRLATCSRGIPPRYSGCGGPERAARNRSSLCARRPVG